MPRAKAVLQSQFPYNISARCINREWFSLPISQVWKIFCEELARTSTEKKLVIHSFVLMSNHFHLLASTPESNVSECMHQFMGRSSRRLTTAGNRINQTFSGRHYKCILHHPNYFLNAYKYNYRNPVAAGICNNVEDYLYSTLHGLLGKSQLAFPVEDTTLAFDQEGTLKWLNTPPDPEKAEAFKFGLKRQFFSPKKCNKTHRQIIDVNDIL